MRCPNGDNILVEKTPVHDGMSVHYLFCPSCRGHWLSAFDANYIKSIDVTSDLPLASKGETLGGYECPQCRRTLARATGDNIPPNVVAFRCPDGHGYFFPAGELVKFKEAQQAKVSYHKLWRIPLRSVASAMLMTFFGLLLSGGLILGIIEGQRQQTITSQAEEIIISQKTYPEANAVTIIAITAENVSLTVVIDGKDYPMLAPDGRSHVARVTGISPGAHSYLFRFQKEGRVLRTSLYSFSSP